MSGFRQIRAAVMAVLMMAGTASWADMDLKDASEIEGTWILESTAARLDGKKVEEGAKWEFAKEGKLITTGKYEVAAAGAAVTMENKYEIKDGKISTDLGHLYTVVEKTDAAMTLRGPFGFYFFKKKQ
jgi:hypothetical protein